MSTTTYMYAHYNSNDIYSRIWTVSRWKKLNVVNSSFSQTLLLLSCVWTLATVMDFKTFCNLTWISARTACFPLWERNAGMQKTIVDWNVYTHTTNSTHIMNVAQVMKTCTVLMYWLYMNENKTPEVQMSHM